MVNEPKLKTRDEAQKTLPCSLEPKHAFSLTFLAPHGKPFGVPALGGRPRCRHNTDSVIGEEPHQVGMCGKDMYP